ncbi:MAG TPA: Fur family transcriptional regulator [Bdellovibrionota bacterium]|nr:Fur family transcriptional regulator [Bdellovibrionota bacterium]
MRRWMDDFERYLSVQGLRHSKRREQVARVFFSMSKHVGIEELYGAVQRVNPKIGIATVYRTLNLLVAANLAARRNFETGATTYEKIPKEHHDHLICTSCGKIVEFQRPEIEKLQDEVAEQYGYELRSHKMELYGLCQSCGAKTKKGEERHATA